MNNPIIHKELTDRVVGLALTVFYELGPGLLEDAYEEAMVWELKHEGIPFTRQKVYPLRYKGDYITTYFADLVVDGKVILELKAVKALDHNMEAVAERTISNFHNKHAFNWRIRFPPSMGLRDTKPSLAVAAHQLT